MKARRIDFSPGDWLGGTLELTLEEEGLYIRICALIWSRGSRITDDLLKASTKVHGNKVNALLASLEAKGKITRNGREIGQKRAENELENAQKRVRNASENGLLGNKIKRLKTATRDGVANASSTSTSTSTSIEEDPEASPLPPADPVKEIFDRGLAILGPTHRSLLGRMRRDHGDEAVLDAILACEAESPSEPLAFFVGCLKRAPPARNGHDKDSPVTKLYRGAYRAAEKVIERERRARGEGDSGAGDPPVVTLLDRR